MKNSAPKVCFLSFAPSIGGVARHQADQLRYLVSLGIKCQIIDESVLATAHCLGAAKESNNLELTNLPLWTDARLAAKLIEKSWKADPPDIIVVSNMGVAIKLSSILKLARKKYNSKLLYINHSRVFHSTFKHMAMELLAAWLLRQYYEIIYVSHFTKHSWERRYPWLVSKKNRVVHNGVITPAHIGKNRSATIRIGFLGRLEPEKDPILFCEVAKLSSQFKLPYSFSMYGNGSLSSKVSTYNAIGLTLFGEFTNLAEIMSNIDLLLVTSTVENCPYAILEAKSYGIPTVAVDVGGIREIVENNIDGILVTTRSANQILDGVQLVVSEYDKLAQGCLKNRARYTFEQNTLSTWSPYFPNLANYQVANDSQ